LRNQTIRINYSNIRIFINLETFNRWTFYRVELKRAPRSGAVIRCCRVTAGGRSDCPHRTVKLNLTSLPERSHVDGTLTSPRMNFLRLTSATFVSIAQIAEHRCDEIDTA